MPDPISILQFTPAYWASMVLVAGDRLGVFTTLAEEPAAAGKLAARCEADPRAQGMLLDAMAAHGLLAKSGDAYRDSEIADAFLVEGRPGSLGDALRYGLDMYPVWGRLPDAVLSGEPPAPAEEILGGDPEKTRHFVLGMHNRALGVAIARELLLESAAPYPNRPVMYSSVCFLAGLRKSFSVSPYSMTSPR